jgi:hypothetical protein
MVEELENLRPRNWTSCQRSIDWAFTVAWGVRWDAGGEDGKGEGEES